MPKIDDYYARYRELSKSASDGARQLSFAALALIWIFKIEVGPTYQLPRELMVATMWVVVSLVLDFLHYFVGSLVWRAWARHLERKEKESEATQSPIPKDHDWRNPTWLPRILEGFYYSKIVALFVAYYFIAVFLLGNLKEAATVTTGGV